MKKIIMASCVVILAIVAVGSFVGCETVEGGAALLVTPAAVTFTGSNSAETVTFTVGGLATDTNGTVGLVGAGELSVPLTWTVSHPSLGNITTTAGNQAVYVSSGGEGVNVVTVEDQYGAQGLATVTQE